MNLRRKLLLVALCTLALPVAGWLYVRQMEALLRDGQAQALLASAGAVARSLVVTGAVQPESGRAWYVQQAPGPITVDPLSVAALATAAIVAVLIIAAVALFAWSTRALGKQWSLTARTRDDHRLITDGPFAHVRHPIYAAMLIQLIALAIALGTEWRLIVALPLFAAGTAIRVGDEESLLRDAFGVDFDAYAARVPRLLPHLRRRRPF